jgi:hypothetical protein
MSKVSPPKPVAYPFEEFCDHMRAMKTVRQWEHTSRFGELGKDQSNRANNARVLEYFCDCYPESGVAIRKAESFLSICDYFARNSLLFGKHGFMEKDRDGVFSVEPALLRAVHHVFTSCTSFGRVLPDKVIDLAKAFEQIHGGSRQQSAGKSQ